MTQPPPDTPATVTPALPGDRSADWAAAARAFTLGLLGTILVGFVLGLVRAYPAGFLVSPALASGAVLGALSSWRVHRLVGLGGTILGVAGGYAIALLVLIRAAPTDQRPPYIWASDVVRDLLIGLAAVAAGWVAVWVIRRFLGGSPRPSLRPSRAAAGLIILAVLVGLAGIPALVAALSQTRIVVSDDVQRVTVEVSGRSVSLVPQTIRSGEVHFFVVGGGAGLVEAFGPLSDAQVAELGSASFNALDAYVGWPALHAVEAGPYGPILAPGRYVWLMSFPTNEARYEFIDAAVLSVGPEAAPRVPPPLPDDAPPLLVAQYLVLTAAGLALAAIAATSRRPVGADRPVRAVLVGLAAVGGPLLILGLMEFAVSFAENPF